MGLELVIMGVNPPEPRLVGVELRCWDSGCVGSELLLPLPYSRLSIENGLLFFFS